jgi:hypothetical protein
MCESPVGTYPAIRRGKEQRLERSDDLAARCAELLAANRTLFDADHPEAAYHALMAALHCAADLEDAPTLRRIEARAVEQHLRVMQRLRPVPPGESHDVRETTRWASLERVYATAERQASTKASTLEVYGRGGAQP